LLQYCKHAHSKTFAAASFSSFSPAFPSHTALALSHGG